MTFARLPCCIIQIHCESYLNWTPSRYKILRSLVSRETDGFNLLIWATSHVLTKLRITLPWFCSEEISSFHNREEQRRKETKHVISSGEEVSCFLYAKIRLEPFSTEVLLSHRTVKDLKSKRTIDVSAKQNASSLFTANVHVLGCFQNVKR